ncbi:MAG: hypothetical protein KZQ96_15765, partial [Candidatus Thiodiazotropha sp. (ex Lucinoma borealis)]|nr:hypothetical protein [Candidatus Thiodiazotropha sp. (ex Lucinoma borealis)]
MRDSSLGSQLKGGIDSPAAHPFGAPTLRCGVLRRFAPGRTKGSNQILSLRQIKRGLMRDSSLGSQLMGGIDSPAAHPFGAPTLRCGVLRRFAPGRTK